MAQADEAVAGATKAVERAFAAAKEDRMRYLLGQTPGWIGTLFVSACCLGAGPLLASAAVASGAGFLASIFNIFVLGPLVIVSVAWTIFNAQRWARASRGAARFSAAFWLTAAGGIFVVAGVFLPPLAGARTAAGAAIYIGLSAMLAGTIWNAVDRRPMGESGNDLSARADSAPATTRPGESA